jgi:hypothetical protein
LYQRALNPSERYLWSCHTIPENIEYTGASALTEAEMMGKAYSIGLFREGLWHFD